MKLIIILILIPYLSFAQFVEKRDSISKARLAKVLDNQKAQRQEFKAFVIGMVVVGILTRKVLNRK